MFYVTYIPWAGEQSKYTKPLRYMWATLAGFQAEWESDTVKKGLSFLPLIYMQHIHIFFIKSKKKCMPGPLLVLFHQSLKSTSEEQKKQPCSRN